MFRKLDVLQEIYIRDNNQLKQEIISVSVIIVELKNKKLHVAFYKVYIRMSYNIKNNNQIRSQSQNESS